VEVGGLLEALRTIRAGGIAVRDWSLFVSRSRRLGVGVKDREAGNPHAPLELTESGGVRYRVVWDDGLVSRGYLERGQVADDPGGALRQARAAAYEDPDAAWVLGPEVFPEVALHDATAAAVAGGETAILERRLDVVRRRVTDCGLRTWSGSFSAVEARSGVLTSRGLDAQSESTLIGWSVSVDGEIGTGHSARRPEPEGQFSARLDRLADLARRLRESGPGAEPGQRPVLLHPAVVEEYVLGTLLENLAGAAVAHGEGHFRREQFGSADPVLREDIALRLEPLVPFSGGAYRFTTEGVPAARCSFIEAGRLVQPVLDLKYARRLGLAPTPLPLTMESLRLLGPRPLSLDEALDEASGGALVLSVLGVHTQDGTSGDFSLSAPQTLAIRSGALAGRLRATISGNLFRVLASADLRFVEFEGEHTPGLLFACRLDPR
jgi:PmbA protein